MRELVWEERAVWIDEGGLNMDSLSYRADVGRYVAVVSYVKSQAEWFATVWGPGVDEKAWFGELSSAQSWAGRMAIGLNDRNS